MGGFSMKKWETATVVVVLLGIWAAGYLLSTIMGMG